MIMECFHTTKIENLLEISKKGLQPRVGNNSNLIADKIKGKLSYSLGKIGLVKMFSSFISFYDRAKEKMFNEDKFMAVLSPKEYQQHLKCVEQIERTNSFEEWISSNVYLCFDGKDIIDKNEEKPHDAYTTETISKDKLKVCIIRDRKDNSIISFSAIDIFSIIYAKNPELPLTMEAYDYEDRINEFKSDRYLLDMININKFCEIFKDIISNISTKEIVNESKKDLDDYML